MSSTRDLRVPSPHGTIGITPRTDYSSFDQRYVAAQGNDDGAGTRSDPWSVTAAEAKATPGTVLNFLDGEYSSTLTPPSGAEEEPVIYRADNRHKAVIAEEGAFELEDTHHVHIQGFHFDGGDWITLTHSSNVVIRDNYMVGGVENNTRFFMEGSDDVKILCNNMKAGGNHNLFVGFPEPRDEEFENVLVAGNSFSRAGHQPAGFFFAFRNTVWRGNVFHSVIGRNVALNGGRRAVFEHNLLVNAYNGPKSGSSKGKFTVQDGIFRFNKLVLNYGAPMNSSPYDDWNTPVGPLRIYNNVLAQNHGGRGWTLLDRTDEEKSIDDTVLLNNIFDGRSCNSPQLEWVDNNERSDVTITRNLFAGSEALVHRDERLPLDEAESRLEYVYDNLSGDPEFTDLEDCVLSLTDESPATDAGTPATRCRSDGSGRTVPVVDARYFHDGFGIDGVPGDPIQIGDQRARVVTVDRDGDSVTVDRSLEWSADDPVNLPWSGDAPDIGLYDSAGEFAQIEIEGPLSAEVGKETTFSATIHGDVSPEEIAWQFGDGGGTTGQTVTHTYTEPYDYGVRVRVTDERGHVHWGTHYVFISDDTVDPASESYNKAEIAKYVLEAAIEEYPKEKLEDWIDMYDT